MYSIGALPSGRCTRLSVAHGIDLTGNASSTSANNNPDFHGGSRQREEASKRTASLAALPGLAYSDLIHSASRSTPPGVFAVEWNPSLLWKVALKSALLAVVRQGMTSLP